MKFLIIGAGMIGETHAGTMLSLGHTVAICDVVCENLERVGNKFGLTERYSDINKALSESAADAVIICTPNHLHAEQTIAALEAGYDVLCEKPMAADSQQARRMYDVARKTGKHLMIGYIVRAYAALDKVREILAGGTLGRIISARCVLATPETLDLARTRYRVSYETGGGIIYDYTHELDYCRMLFGAADEVFAFCGSYLRPEESVDDSADMLIKYNSGVVLTLHMDYIQRAGRTAYSRSFEIICEKGSLECDFSRVRADYNDGHSEEFRCSKDWNEAFTKQACRFIDFCAGKDVPHASAEDGLRALELADALYESFRTHAAVKLA